MNDIIKYLNSKSSNKNPIANNYNTFQETKKQFNFIKDWDNKKIFCFARYGIYKNNNQKCFVIKIVFMALNTIQEIGFNNKYQTIEFEKDDMINKFFNSSDNLYYITDVQRIKIYLNEEDIVNIKDTLLYQILFSKNNQYKNIYIDSKGEEVNCIDNIVDLFKFYPILSKPKRILSNETYINCYDSLFYMLDTLTIDGITIQQTMLFKTYILTCLFENIRFIKKDRNFKDVEYFLTVSSISVFWNVKRKE